MISPPRPWHQCPNFSWPQFEYVKVPLADIPHAPIRLYFDVVADKIHSVSKKCGATLRPPSMKFHNLCLPEACHQTQPEFLEQLIDYESQLFEKSVVKMVQTLYGIVPDVYEKESRHVMLYWGDLVLPQLASTGPQQYQHLPHTISSPLALSLWFSRERFYTGRSGLRTAEGNHIRCW